jgi:hypothetical protein
MTPQCVSTPYRVGTFKDKYTSYFTESINGGAGSFWRKKKARVDNRDRPN